MILMNGPSTRMAAGFARTAVIAAGALLIAVSLGASAAARPAPVADTAATGVAYVGTTSQRQDVLVVLSRNRRQVKRMVANWFVSAARCGSREAEFGSVEFGRPFTAPIRIRRGGRFSDASSGLITLRPGDLSLLPQGGTVVEDEQVKGRVTRSGGRGTSREVVTYKNPAGNVVKRCDTGQVRWKVLQ